MSYSITPFASSYSIDPCVEKARAPGKTASGYINSMYTTLAPGVGGIDCTIFETAVAIVSSFHDGAYDRNPFVSPCTFVLVFSKVAAAHGKRLSAEWVKTDAFLSILEGMLDRESGVWFNNAVAEFGLVLVRREAFTPVIYDYLSAR